MPSHRHPTRRYADVDARRAAALRCFENRPFTRSQALAAGLTINDLKSDAVQPVLRSTYVASGVPIDHHVRCAAALVSLPPGSSIAGVDAARLFDLPVPRSERVQVCLPPNARRRGNDLSIVQARPGRTLEKVHLPRLNLDIAATTPSQLVEECAHLSLVDAVVLADAIIGWCEKRGTPLLATPLDHWTRRARSQRAWRLARPRVESPMETRLRLLLVLAGFPEPVLQHLVRIDGETYRLDLAYPALKVAIEYDGEHHFASAAQRRLDRMRDEALHRAGWVIIHVTAHGVHRDPAGTLRRVSNAFATRGFPFNPEQGWRGHFTQIAA